MTLLATTKGVGDNSALSLLVAMPEFGKITNKEAASLAGVAPFNRDSGKMRGQRKIFGGRKEVRRALYMAALVGSRHNDILKGFYQRLLEKGKPKKLVLIALMVCFWFQPKVSLISSIILLLPVRFLLG